MVDRIPNGCTTCDGTQALATHPCAGRVGNDETEKQHHDSAAIVLVELERGTGKDLLIKRKEQGGLYESRVPRGAQERQAWIPTAVWSGFLVAGAISLLDDLYRTSTLIGVACSHLSSSGFLVLVLVLVLAAWWLEHVDECQFLVLDFGSNQQSNSLPTIIFLVLIAHSHRFTDCITVCQFIPVIAGDN